MQKQLCILTFFKKGITPFFFEIMVSLILLLSL